MPKANGDYTIMVATFYFLSQKFYPNIDSAQDHGFDHYEGTVFGKGHK